MEKKEFCKAVVERLQEMYPDLEVQHHEVRKTNDVVLNGITVSEGASIAPNIYVDSMHENGISVEAAANRVYAIYLTHKNMSPDFDEELFRDWNWVKPNLIYSVVNTERNEQLLETAVHEDFLDLSLICKVYLGDDADQTATITVHKVHVELWGVSEEEVLQAAKENTPRLLPAQLQNMNDIIKEIMPDDFKEEIPPAPHMMLVLSNNKRLHGATALLYPDMLKNIYESVGTFALLPSSLHEVIIVPLEDTSALPELTEMVHQVNVTQVRDEDFLSDHAYFYDGTELTY